jgi:hypothetical protein
LIQDIGYLVNYSELNSGQKNGLIVKLNNAVENLNLGNKEESINNLNSFINEVNGFIKSEKLTTQDGQNMIDLANYVINDVSQNN